MVLYVVAEYAAKRYALAPTWKWYWMAVLIYWMISLCWMPVIKHTNTLAVTSVVWSIVYTALSFLVGIGMFGERLTVTQLVGLAFGLISIILLTVEPK